MATESTAQTGGNQPSSRMRPMRALPLPNLTPILSEDEKNLSPVEDSVLQRIQGSQEDVRWRDPYQRHPPSPPVRERDYVLQSAKQDIFKPAGQNGLWHFLIMVYLKVFRQMLFCASHVLK